MSNAIPDYGDLHALVSRIAAATFEAWRATPEHLPARTDMALAVMALHDAANSLRELVA